MAYYKIKNITGSLAKRHQNKDMELKVEYLVGFQKKVYTLPVGQELVMSCKALPLQIHTLRAKGLVNVIEISENEFMKLQKPSAKKTSVEKEINEDSTENTTEKKKKKKSQPTKTSTIFLANND